MKQTDQASIIVPTIGDFAFRDESERFKIQLQDISKKIDRQVRIPASRPLTLKKASARWWWTQSEADFQLFENDSDAQGYELLRRLTKYQQQLFFYDNPEKTWKQLHPCAQILFVSQYGRDLVKMGLAKQIFFSPKCIDFDCRLPSRYLIQALKEELRRPTPLIAGTYGRSLIPKAVSVKEQAVLAYTN